MILNILIKWILWTPCFYNKITYMVLFFFLYAYIFMFSFLWQLYWDMVSWVCAYAKIHQIVYIKMCSFLLSTKIAIFKSTLVMGTRLLDLAEKFLQWKKKYFVITCKDQLYWMKFQWGRYRLSLLFTFEHILRIAVNYHDRSNPGKIMLSFYCL